MRRLLITITLLVWTFTLFADPTEGKDTQEAQARWEKILDLKNSSKTKEMADEAAVQMEWFRSHEQWDYYYRVWQLKANALSAEGKLQLALQETQRMLEDAKAHQNKLGHAMAYKQIGVIYLNMKQTEPAVEALQHYAELIKDEEEDLTLLSNVYYRIAKAYDYDQNYDEEQRVTSEWLGFLHTKFGKQEKPEIRECYNACYLARAAAFIGLKKLDEAGMALDTAAHHAHIVNTSLSLHHLYKMQARYYLAKGDAANALLYTDSVRLVTDEKDDHTDEIRAQALIMLGQGEEAALIYQRLYHEKDSVFGRDARLHLDELNTLFQLDELKTEQQRTRFRYTLIAASSIVLALLLLWLIGLRSSIKQKKANEQLRIANERTKATMKMRSKFIRNISHEIRTPLNIVSGFTQILAMPDMDIPKSEKRDMQERVTENTERITNLVDRMLELSDTGSETVIERNDETNARAIVEEAIKHSGITLHTKPRHAESAVTFESPDEQALARITLRTNQRNAIRALAQLLENAVKFTNEGTIRLLIEDAEEKVRFVVEDTGIGIPANQRKHVFEEFVQLDEFVDGAGIGLTIARSIAERMGGRLWLDTNYTQGSRFVLELLK